MPRSRLPLIPPARVEGQGSGSLGIKVRSPLHDKRRVANGRIFQDTDGGQTVWPAAMRKRSVFKGETDVEGNDGVETKGLVHRILPVITISEAEGRVMKTEDILGGISCSLDLDMLGLGPSLRVG